MATDVMHSRADIEREIVVRTWRDAEFREKLLASPKEALMEYFACDFEDEIKVHIHEEDFRNIHLRIPAHPANGHNGHNSVADLGDDPNEIMNPHNQTGPGGTAFSFCTLC